MHIIYHYLVVFNVYTYPTSSGLFCLEEKAKRGQALVIHLLTK